MFHLPGDNSIAYYADTVRIRDHHGSIQEAGVVHPGCAGHLAVAIERKPGREHSIVRCFPPGMDSRHPRPHRTFSRLKLSRARDQCGVANLDPPDVGDGVVWPGFSVKRNAQISAASLLFRAETGRKK